MAVRSETKEAEYGLVGPRGVHGGRSEYLAALCASAEDHKRATGSTSPGFGGQVHFNKYICK